MVTASERGGHALATLGLWQRVLHACCEFQVVDWQGVCLQPALVAPALARTKMMPNDQPNFPYQLPPPPHPGPQPPAPSPDRLIPNPNVGEWQDQCLQPALIVPAFAHVLVASKKRTAFSNPNPTFPTSPSRTPNAQHPPGSDSSPMCCAATYKESVTGSEGVDTSNDGNDGRSTHGTVCEGLGAVWAGCLVAAGSEYDCGFCVVQCRGTSTSTGITSSCVAEGVESEGGEGGGWRCGGGGG